MDWNDKEQVREYNRNYVERNKSRLRIKNKEWAANNKEKRKSISLRYYYSHKEDILEKDKIKREEKRKSKPAKEAFDKKKWFDEHKDSKREYDAVYRATKLDKGNKKIREQDRHLIKRFGITLEDYNNILISQNYKCKICGKGYSESKVALAVDHDHITGKVRGLLCYNCNIGLGNYRDSIELLEKAIIYLKEQQNG